MWDKIAVVGQHTDMHGKIYTFTAADFQTIADNYSKAAEKAPLVLGHPSNDAPAYGWIVALRVNGDYLEAQYENVSEEVIDLVNNGAYQYKSVSLFPDLKRIKHVGLLGAVPPAMSGLGKIEFNSSEGTVLYFASSSLVPDSDIEALTNRLSKAIIKNAQLEYQIEELTKAVASNFCYSDFSASSYSMNDILSKL